MTLSTESTSGIPLPPKNLFQLQTRIQSISEHVPYPEVMSARVDLLSLDERPVTHLLEIPQLTLSDRRQELVQRALFHGLPSMDSECPYL